MRHLSRTATVCLALAMLGTGAFAGQAAGKARPDPVKRTVERAFARGKIDAPTRRGYLSSYAKARKAKRKLSGGRRAELAYVLDTLRRLARERRLTARLPAMFLVLDRNRQWWTKAGPPLSGARLTFGASRVIFQYFPGRGLQFHPLANFGRANGYWMGRRNQDLRSLLEDLLEIGVRRGGFLTWEYYFNFNGGSPPWISAMAQGTAMQALARASRRLSDPSLLRAARRARGAFQRATPLGVRSRQGRLYWYPLYSFAPRLNVLNGMLQAVNGLRTYTAYADDRVAEKLFATGDRTARAQISRFDTGAWSLYSRPSGRPGPEASLNYHTLNRDFARNLCKGTDARAYCRAADRFTRYLKEDPRLEPARAVPAPARAGRAVKFRFRLSKVSRVGITVREARTRRLRLSTSASFSHGERFFRWVPPRSRKERIYDFWITARDLAGNTGSAKGSIRVKPSRKR